MPFHAIASLSGGRQKTIPNRTEEQMLAEVVLPFVSSGVITAKWGSTKQSYQVLELRIYKSEAPWDKKKGPLADLIKGKPNRYASFDHRAQQLLRDRNTDRVIGARIEGICGPTFRPKPDGSYSVGAPGEVLHYRPIPGGGHTVNQQ